MWTSEVNSFELFGANRWTVSYFAESKGTVLSGFPMRALREVAHERKGSADPQALGEIEINYLGLENVRPLTGELVDFAPRLASSVKSRSKVFQPGDVLYSRLRPELNKVFLAEDNVTEGLCSGEFIVLVPRTDIVLSRYLRHVLASSFVTQFASKFKVGASLPRMATDDLLGIGIPLPPLAIQTKLVEKLAKIDREIERLRIKVTELPEKSASAFLAAIASGSDLLEMS